MPLVTSQDNILVRAIMNGDADAVGVLPGEGANAEVRDKSGLTALRSASWGDNMEIVRALIATGADVNARDWNGLTALKFAELHSRTGVANLLTRATGRG